MNILKILLNYLKYRPRGLVSNAEKWISSFNNTTPLDLRYGPGNIFWHDQGSQLLTYEAPYDAFLNAAVDNFPLRIAVSHPSALYRLLNCRVVGQSAAVLSPDGKLFQQFTYSIPNKPYAHPIFKRRRFVDPVILKGSWASLVYPSSSAWFHWIAESLPRLKLIEHILPYLNGVMIPSSPHSQIRESVLAMGLRSDQIIELNSDSHYIPEVLFVPFYAAGMNMAPWVPKFLQSKLQLNNHANSVGSPRRIYISREDAKVRRLVNEKEITSILVTHGFEIIKLADISFHEQVELFNNAELIVAPHGAGLANLVFCQPNVRVLELLSTQNQLPCLYYAMTNTVGGHYSFLRGSPIEGQDPNNPNADFRIKLLYLENALSWLFQS